MNHRNFLMKSSRISSKYIDAYNQIKETRNTQTHTSNRKTGPDIVAEEEKSSTERNEKLESSSNVTGTESNAWF